MVLFLAGVVIGAGIAWMLVTWAWIDQEETNEQN